MWRTDLPINVLGFLSGDTIVMQRKQSQVERRTTLTHELIHHERGDDRCDGRDEEYVRQETARRLITLDSLADALRWSTDVHEMADHCWVDVDVMLTRLDHLHPAERAYLRRVTEHHRMETGDAVAH